MTRKEYLLAQKEEGWHVFGVFPALYPKEIFWAFKIIPAEIWDPPVSLIQSGRHLQAYICSVVQLGLEFILQGKGDLLDGYLFPHTCDSIQNLASVVNDFVKDGRTCHHFYHPKAPYRPESRVFYTAQLSALIKALEDRFGPLDRQKLVQAVETGRRISQQVDHVYRLRARGKLAVSNEEFYRILRSGEYLSPHDYLETLNTLAAHESETGKQAKTRVVISGVLPNPPEILGLLDDLGVTVAGDDFLAVGRRLAPVGEETAEKDPLTILTDSYFRLPPCSTKGSAIAERAELLFDMARETNAKGIIFWQVKYCEPELFDVPFLSEELKKRNLKVLVLDTELNHGLTGQISTRIEAFIEML